MGTPKKKVFKVRGLIDHIGILASAYSNADNIQLKTTVSPESLEILADENQVSQVLINLVKNAYQALGEVDGGKVNIQASLNKDGRPEISVADNRD